MKKSIKIYEREYDNPKNEDGSDKPNKLLGSFEMVEGDMNDYSYTCYIRKTNGKLYKLQGFEVSYQNGGTRNVLTELEDTPDVKAYLTYSKLK
jgi:hypothetical protein